MVVMTIQGDLRDIDSDERNIPKYLGVERESLFSKRVRLPFKFVILIDCLVIAKFVAIGVITLPDNIAMAAWGVVTLLGYSVHNKILVVVRDGDMESITQWITYYTAITLVAVCVALYMVADIQSIIALILFSLVWGFVWQRVLYGSHSQFG